MRVVSETVLVIASRFLKIYSKRNSPLFFGIVTSADSRMGVRITSHYYLAIIADAELSGKALPSRRE